MAPSSNQLGLESLNPAIGGVALPGRLGGPGTSIAGKVSVAEQFIFGPARTICGDRNLAISVSVKCPKLGPLRQRRAVNKRPAGLGQYDGPIGDCKGAGVVWIGVQSMVGYHQLGIGLAQDLGKLDGGDGSSRTVCSEKPSVVSLHPNCFAELAIVSSARSGGRPLPGSKRSTITTIVGGLEGECARSRPPQAISASSG